MMLHSIAIGWSITESISIKTVDVKNHYAHRQKPHSGSAKMILNVSY